MDYEFLMVIVCWWRSEWSQSTMSSDTDRPVSAAMTSVMADVKDDASKEVKLVLSGGDSSVSQRWTTRPPAAAAAGTHHDNSDKEHHDSTEKMSVAELPGIYQHGNTQRSICPTAPPLYGRLAGAEFDSGYDYSYSSQYSSRYTTFQGPPTSSYVAAVTPYATPYSPADFSAYLAGPCATGAAYNPSYVPHHLTPPPAALTSERSAPSYRFNASSTSLLQSRTFTCCKTLLSLTVGPRCTSSHN